MRWLTLAKGNILVNDEGMIQLMDYGLASLTDESAPSYTVHHLLWTAPELIYLESKPQDSDISELRRPTHATDIYSFGCLCIEVRRSACQEEYRY